MMSRIFMIVGSAVLFVALLATRLGLSQQKWLRSVKRR